MYAAAVRGAREPAHDGQQDPLQPPTPPQVGSVASSEVQ
jgi:hypothetical protein